MSISNVETIKPEVPKHSFVKNVWVLPALLALIAFVVPSVVTYTHGTQMSPIDEWVYLDYLEKLPVTGPPQGGEAIGQRSLDRMACDGVFPYGRMGPKCHGDYSDLSQFPQSGITSADPYTPLYFAITWVIAKPIQFVTGASDLLSWRFTGTLWLIASILVLYTMLRRWNASQGAAFGLSLVFIGTPYAWWTYSYVNTDVPSFLMGLLILLFADRFVKGQSTGWLVVGLALIAMAFKVTNILGIALGAIYIVLYSLNQYLSQRNIDAKQELKKLYRNLTCAVLSVVLPLVGEYSWLKWHNSQSVGGGSTQGVSTSLDIQELVIQMTNFLPGTIRSNVNIAGGGEGYAIPGFVFTPLSWICIAGVVSAFWSLKKNDKLGPLVNSVAIASVFGAPALALAITVMVGSYFPIPPRYGASILAGILIVTGLSIKNKVAIGILIGYGAALCIIALTLSRFMT